MIADGWIPEQDDEVDGSFDLLVQCGKGAGI